MTTEERLEKMEQELKETKVVLTTTKLRNRWVLGGGAILILGLLLWLLVMFAIGRSQQTVVYETIHEAARAGNLTDVKRHLKRGAIVNAKSEHGWTPLYAAASGNNLDTVKYLVDKGADVNVSDKIGVTPLYVAALLGNLDMVKFLIKHGAHLDGTVVNVDRETVFTPLLGAVSDGRWDTIEYLVNKGADVNVKDKTGKIPDVTPLYLAALHGWLDLVKFLVEHGAHLDGTVLNEDRETVSMPLHVAAAGGHLDIVKYLVDKGADVNAKDKTGETPLYWAKRFKKEDIVNFLKEHGAKE